MDSSPGHFAMWNVTLEYCLEWAYDLKEFEIEGPTWIKSGGTGYDIVAKAVGPASDGEMKLMLQTLLIERFEMKLHRETKTLEVCALLPGKGAASLKEAAAGERPAFAGNAVTATFTSQPISRLTLLLTRRMDRPVVDMTGLRGLYDFRLDLSGLGSGNPSSPSIFTTVQDNLGLKLQPQKAPIEILVIDSAEKVPTAN
jgi:uncharacterized protein (TIGR03435 family)